MQLAAQRRFRVLALVARGSASCTPQGQPYRSGMASQGQEGQTMTTTVLVADDDPDLRETLRDILEAEQYGVLEAQNGIEALDLLRATSPPLVVLLDLHMPQLDGAGVLGVVAANK